MEWELRWGPAAWEKTWMVFLLFARRWCVSRSGTLQIVQRSNGGPFVALWLLRYRTRYHRYQELNG